LGESDRTSFKKIDYRLQKLVWFYAKVNYEGGFLDKIAHGEISGIEEGPTYDIIDLKKAYDKIPKNIM
jgi:hypothetical protein